MSLKLPGDNSRASSNRPLASALFFGTGSGVFGVCIGGAIGILKSAHPGLAAAYTGLQFFVLGSSASLTRDVVLAVPLSSQHKRNELIASTTAGVVAGAAAGRFWSRMAFIPGGFLFGAVGFLGQRYVHRSNAMPQVERDRRSFGQRFADLRWSPIKNMSNDDYHKILTERLLKLDAEIDLVNGKLQELRRMSVSDEATNGK